MILILGLVLFSVEHFQQVLFSNVYIHTYTQQACINEMYNIILFTFIPVHIPVSINRIGAAYQRSKSRRVWYKSMSKAGLGPARARVEPYF